uniref:Uncharacterized protein n=1 Tax=Anguilla anguilla TaxID=7936 RepID=A0A0E9X6B3_ANGAN
MQLIVKSSLLYPCLQENHKQQGCVSIQRKMFLYSEMPTDILSIIVETNGFLYAIPLTLFTLAKGNFRAFLQKIEWGLENGSSDTGIRGGDIQKLLSSKQVKCDTGEMERSNTA